MKVCPECKGVCRDADRICPSCGSEVKAQDLVDGDGLVGLRLADKYELVEYIGEGAMGWVYRGLHLSLESSVAVKIMKPQMRPDEQRAERFKREARASSRLNHPHIISVIDFGETPSGLLYLVTEFLTGVSLAQLMDREDVLAFKRTVRILSQILSALEESHNAGVIHRDLKPDNIMVTQLRGGEDFVKVLDFGIAKMRDDGDQKLTQAGQLFGTPDYMAPEQIKGQELSGAADLYAVGVILFQMLSGRLPFEAENFFDVLKDHLYTRPPKLAEADPGSYFPDELQQILDRALAKNPANRFSAAAEFRQALRQTRRLVTGTVKKCPQCSEVIELGVQFCPNCGQKIPITQPAGKKEKVATAETALDISHFDPAAPVGAVGAEPDPGRDSQPTIDRLWRSMSIALPMMQRQAETAAVDSLLTGEIRVIHLAGPIGIGKTTIARLAVGKARQQGFATHWIEPHPSSLPLSWEPVRVAVAGALSLKDPPTENELAAAVGAQPALKRDLAGLATLFNLPGPLDSADPETRKNEAMASAQRALLLTATQPTLCVFEDVDLFDEPSRRFVLRLAARSGDSNLRLVITSGMPMVKDQTWVANFELEPLKTDTIGSLVKKMMPRPSESWAGIMQKIMQTADGNPLWLQQALALATESGTESDAVLTDLISTRVNRLPGPTQQILQALAVLGQEAPLEAVSSIMTESASPFEHLKLAVYLGLLEHPDVAGRNAPGADARRQSFIGHLKKPDQALRFTHPLLVEVIRETIPAEVRQELSKRALERLTARNAPMAVRAHFAAAAGEHELAVVLLEQAADHALNAFDAPGAAQLCRRAVEISRWKLLMEEDSPDWLRLNLKLGDALHQSGDMNAAHVVLRSVEGSCSRQPLLAAKTRGRLAHVFLDLNRPLRAVEVMRRAIGDAIMGGDPEVLTEMYLELAELMARTGDYATAIQELTEGVDLVTAGAGLECESGPTLMWKLLSRVAQLRLESSEKTADLDIALQWARASLSHAERVKSPVGLATSHLLLAEIHQKAQHAEPASKHFAEALKVLRSLGDRKGQAQCLLRAAMDGNGTGEQDTKDAYELASEVGWSEGMEQATNVAPHHRNTGLS